MLVARPAALEADPDGPVQPADVGRELGQERLAQEQALTLRRDRPEPQLATLIAAVNDRSLKKAADTVMVPVEDLEQLFA